MSSPHLQQAQLDRNRNIKPIPFQFVNKWTSVLRVFALCLAALVVPSLAHASGVIARLIDPGDLSSIVAAYPEILNYERAGRSPFYRFEVTYDNERTLRDELRADQRIDWADAEDFDGDRTRYSSHGSSLAAIFKRKHQAGPNQSVFSQINFVPMSGSCPSAKIGIVDNGISPLQQQLKNKVIAELNLIAAGAPADDLPNGTDSNLNGIADEAAGHGTMVAGLINQMAPNAQFIVAKVADSDGNANAWNAFKGIVFCVENGAQVINMSLGAPDTLPGFQGLLNWMDDQGSLLVTPIGNNNMQGGLMPSQIYRTVCVAGVNSDGTKASFSNWSVRTRVSAPAIGITSTWWDGSMATVSGTSLAAPLVVGALASLPNGIPRNPVLLRQALYESGHAIDDINPNYSGQLGKLLDCQALRQYLGQN